MDFYLYLPSNTGDYDVNTLSNFKVKLPHRVDLEGQWEVALVEIGYPVTWFNIGTEEEATVAVSFKEGSEYRKKTIPFNNYTSAEQLCDALNYALDHMPDANNERTNFGFRYDEINQRVGLKPRGNYNVSNVHFVRLSPQLQYMLGFDEDTISPSQAKITAHFTQHKQQSVNVQLHEVKSKVNANVFTFLNNIISTIITTNGELINVELRYNAKLNTIQLLPKEEHAEPNVLYLVLSPNLQHNLGLVDNTIFPYTSYKVYSAIAMKADKRLIVAERIPDLRAGQYSMFVYCDVVVPQIVGNVIAPILRVVSTSEEYATVVDKNYDNPHYIPVLKREFDTIEININDDRGRPINFQYGKVFVKLHFRKQQ